MRRRFGRGRRGGQNDGGRAAIDAGPWLEKIVAEGISGANTLTPLDLSDIPKTFAILASGETEDGKRVTPDVKKGQKVLIGKYSGTEVKIDGTEYIILREDDVLGIVG